MEEKEEAKKFYVYIHFKKDSLEPFYIGKGTGGRMKATSHRNQYWQRIVNKHGFIADVLKYFSSSEAAFDYEKEMIKFFRDQGFKLCNLTDGGDGAAGVTISPETRLKMSIAKKGVKKSPEHIEKIRMSSKGRKASEATKAKMRESAKKVSPEVKARRVAWAKGKPRSPETKAKMSASLKGRLSHRLGKSRTVIATNIETGEEIEIRGKDEMKAAGFAHYGISKCLTGKQHSHKGHTFKLKEDKEYIENGVTE